MLNDISNYLKITMREIPSQNKKALKTAYALASLTNTFEMRQKMGNLLPEVCYLVVIAAVQLANCAPLAIGKGVGDVLLNLWENTGEAYDSEPWAEGGDKFEGDMVLSAAQRQLVQAAAEGEHSRNGLRGATKRWPGNEVVYHIRAGDFEPEQVKLIEDALADIANHSCIRFRPRPDDHEHAVTIQGTASGCFSNVGYQSDEDESQVLNLARGCFRHGTVVHEMLHTLGFYHMQSTHDRDDYVKIHWENIVEGTEHNFIKYNNDTVTDFGVSYDYDSVMHYPAAAFSKNGNNTIEPLQANVVIGQRNGMSEKDILKLKRMYCEKAIDNKINHSY